MLLCVVAYLLTLPCTYSHMMIIRFLPRSHHYPSWTCCCWKSIDKWSVNEGTKTREFFPDKRSRDDFRGNLCMLHISGIIMHATEWQRTFFVQQLAPLFCWLIINLSTYRSLYSHSAPVDVHFLFHADQRWIFSTLSDTRYHHHHHHQPFFPPLLALKLKIFTFSAYYCFTGLPGLVLARHPIINLIGDAKNSSNNALSSMLRNSNVIKK